MAVRGKSSGRSMWDRLSSLSIPSGGPQMTDWKVGPTTRLSSLDGLLAIRRNLFLLDDPIDQPAVGADQIAANQIHASVELAAFADDLS